MRKISIILILILTTLLFSGCPGPESEQKQSEGKENESKKRIEMSSAKDFMDNYMRYVIKMDKDVMKSFYTPKFREQIKDVAQTSNPHPIGYKLGEGESKGETAEYTVDIFNAYTGTPYYSTDTYKYTVVMEDGKLYIDNITKDKVMEVFEKNKALFMKEGSKVQGKQVMSLDELPTYASPQASPEMKLQVPRDAFGPCSLAPDGKKLVMSSTGKDSFIAMGEFEEEQSAMAQGEGKQGAGSGSEGGKGGGGEGGQEGGKSKEDQEKPQKAKIKLQPIDLYTNSKINIIVYSPDGKTIAVENTPQGGLSQIRLYKGDSGEGIKTHKISNNFRADRFTLSSPYFTSPTALSFKVKAVADAQDEEKDLEGEWTYDLKTETLKQTK